MQNGKSRIKRVASAVIAGVMALQTVAPVISYADDTASSVATTDDSDAMVIQQKSKHLMMAIPLKSSIRTFLLFLRRKNPRRKNLQRLHLW